MGDLTVVSPTGMLGYGIPADSLERAITAYDIDYIACDAGSIDQGPDYLGRGKFLADENMVERDIRLLLSAVDRLDVPLLLSSAGGSGSAEHLDKVVDIYRRIVNENEYELDLATIYTDVSPDFFKTKLANGEVETLDLETDLTPDEVDATAKTVGQIGPDPYIEAIESGADVVIGGRSIDEAPFAAIPLIEGYDEGLTYHMAKILECGAMASEPRSGSDCLVGFLSADAFEVEPASPDRRCTVQSVAAHTLYEKADPYTLHLPTGEVDLSGSSFAQVTDRRVRVSNSEFEPAASYTVLVEGVTQTGYRTIAPAGIRGMEATSQIEAIVDRVLEKITEMVEIEPDRYHVAVRQYGKNGVPITPGQDLEPGPELGIIIDVVGDTQEIANTVCGMARSTMLHQSFEGRLAVSGNLAIPYSPADIEVGPTYEFSIHHLLTRVDPADIYTLRTEVPA